MPQRLRAEPSIECPWASSPRNVPYLCHESTRSRGSAPALEPLTFAPLPELMLGPLSSFFGCDARKRREHGQFDLSGTEGLTALDTAERDRVGLPVMWCLSVCLTGSRRTPQRQPTSSRSGLGPAVPHTMYSHCAANRPVAGRQASVLSQTTRPRHSQ